jgi:hypothetical protein
MRSAAARGAARAVRIDDRASWDRASWNRYLAEATRIEPKYMPIMLRLLSEIGRLERLTMLADAAAAACSLRFQPTEPTAPEHTKLPVA